MHGLFQDYRKCVRVWYNQSLDLHFFATLSNQANTFVPRLQFYIISDILIVYRAMHLAHIFRVGLLLTNPCNLLH